MPRSLIDSHIHFSSHVRLNELECYQREIGAQKICLLSLPVTTRINFNPEVLYAKIRLGARCYGLASFDYGSLLVSSGGAGSVDLDLPGQVQRFRELGFDGLKIFLGKPSFQSLLGLRLNDPELLDAFRRAEHLRMPVLIHVADPLIFWSYRSVPGFIPPGWEQALSQGGAGIPDYEDLQEQALDVLRACPDLTVIFPHLLSMGQDIPRLARVLDAHPRAFLDLAPGLYFYYELDRQREQAREFFQRYADRILFGTDAFWFPRWFSEFPYASVEDNLRRGRHLLRFLETEEILDNPFVPTQGIRAQVRGLGLDRAIVETICLYNFTDLYPPEPRAVDSRACAVYLEEFLERLAAAGASADIVDGAAQLRRSMDEPSRDSTR
jgi:predicted TIM-barrel fold metal-dependent hydrolase